jgi:hypothetical protein
MKNILFVLLAAFVVALLIPTSVQAQASAASNPRYDPVATENTRDLWCSYTSTSSQDTLKPTGYYTATAKECKFVVAINVNTAVASDSIFVWEGTNVSGTKYLAKIIIPATPAPYQFSLPVNVAIDSNYVVIKRYKTSDVTLVWRKNF